MDIELTAHHQENAMDAILQQLQKLPTSEKLNLVQVLWNDIAQSSMPIPASEEVQVELLRRSSLASSQPRPQPVAGGNRSETRCPVVNRFSKFQAFLASTAYSKIASNYQFQQTTTYTGIQHRA